jgi:hypothetical protein
MKFYVSMKVDGRVTVEVDAKDAQDAFDKAIERWESEDVDFNKDMEIVDSYPVNCEDEDGNLTDSNY